MESTCSLLVHNAAEDQKQKFLLCSAKPHQTEVWRKLNPATENKYEQEVFSCRGGQKAWELYLRTSVFPSFDFKLTNCQNAEIKCTYNYCIVVSGALYTELLHNYLLNTYVFSLGANHVFITTILQLPSIINLLHDYPVTRFNGSNSLWNIWLLLCCFQVRISVRFLILHAVCEPNWTVLNFYFADSCGEIRLRQKQLY